MNSPITRRRFLGQASCAAVSSLPILSTLLNLKLAGTVAAQVPTSEYRAVVCLFLNGGNDSFNMLAPRGNDGGYAEYAAVRGDLALPQASLLPINPQGYSGPQLGVHPGMPELQSLFESGDAAFVANVGTLLQPVTKAEYLAGSKPVPLGLFSHSDQIEQWQTGISVHRSGIGWGGRAADLLHSLNSTQSVSMNVSLAGSNVFQTGNEIFEYAITENGATELAGYQKQWQAGGSLNQIRSAAVDGMLAREYSNILQRSFARSERSAVDAYDLFTNAIAPALPPGASFANSGSPLLVKQMQMVVKAIAGRAALGAKRQTFFLSLGGWDHHDEVIANQAAMLPVVSAAVGGFYQALVALGIENQVTLFLASDFGRTLSSNGRGSDHAWGSNVFVVGGAVNGKRIHGSYPALYDNNPLDTGRGRLIPTTSVDAYFAELALWLGVPKSSLPLVLPNITSHYNLASAANPVGFLPVS